ncbi:MAG: peptidylprolyl isomerase [Anaerolineales bacterium]
MADEKKKVQAGRVVAMDYTLHVDGEKIDSSEGREPLEYLHGAGNIIPGLEREMAGMEVGESKQVVVSPADGYGESDPNAFIEIPRSEFPQDIPLEVGLELQVQDPSGNPMYARIDAITDESVRLDFNHPLAGKELHFSVKIVGLREPTEEELDHGHVHSGGDHEH